MRILGLFVYDVKCLFKKLSLCSLKASSIILDFGLSVRLLRYSTTSTARLVEILIFFESDRFLPAPDRLPPFLDRVGLVFIV